MVQRKKVDLKSREGQRRLLESVFNEPILDEGALNAINLQKQKCISDPNYKAFMNEKLKNVFISIVKTRRTLAMFKPDDLLAKEIWDLLGRSCKKFSAVCLALNLKPHQTFYASLENLSKMIGAGKYSFTGTDSFARSDIPLLQKIAAQKELSFVTPCTSELEHLYKDFEKDFTPEEPVRSISIHDKDIASGKPFTLGKSLFRELPEVSAFVPITPEFREFEITLKSKSPLDFKGITEDLNYFVDMTFKLERTLFMLDALHSQSPNKLVFRHYYPRNEWHAKEILKKGIFSEKRLSKLSALVSPDELAQLHEIVRPLLGGTHADVAARIHDLIFQKGSGQRTEFCEDMNLSYLLSEYTEHGEFKGTCKSHSVLSVGLLLAAGIPARIASSYVHAWAEIMALHEGKQYWIPFDTSNGRLFEFGGSHDGIYTLCDTLPESAEGATITFRSLL